MMVPELPILLPFGEPQSHIKPYAMGKGTLETVWIEDYQAPQVVPAVPVDRAAHSNLWVAARPTSFLSRSIRWRSP
jgi:hypothetical protein